MLGEITLPLSRNILLKNSVAKIVLAYNYGQQYKFTMQAHFFAFFIGCKQVDFVASF